jgi:hypothetical protein
VNPITDINVTMGMNRSFPPPPPSSIFPPPLP